MREATGARAVYPQRELTDAAPLLAAAATLAAGLVAPALAALMAAGALALALTRGRLRIAHTAQARDFAGPLLAITAVGFVWGFDAAMGAFLAWRMFADAAWSARTGRRLAQVSGRGESGWRSAHYFFTPALGLTLAAYTAPHVLLGLPLDLPHAPLIAPLIVGAAAAWALFDWGVRRLADWRLDGGDGAATRHALAHHALFLAAYAASPDLSAGLMALVVWRLGKSVVAAQ